MYIRSIIVPDIDHSPALFANRGDHIHPGGEDPKRPSVGTRPRIGRPRSDAGEFRFSRNVGFPGNFVPRIFFAGKSISGQYRSRNSIPRKSILTGNMTRALPGEIPRSHSRSVSQSKQLQAHDARLRPRSSSRFGVPWSLR